MAFLGLNQLLQAFLAKILAITAPLSDPMKNHSMYKSQVNDCMHTCLPKTERNIMQQACGEGAKLQETIHITDRCLQPRHQSSLITERRKL